MLTRAIRDFGNFMFLKLLNRWVAGDKAEDAVRYCRRLKCRSCHCVINYLGEHHLEVASVLNTVREYRRLIGLISGSRTAITIKPSQFGFNVMARKDSEKFCQQQMLEVIKDASGKKILTWLDMEDSRYTDFTFRFYKKFASKYRLGICLQANLRRSEGDLLDLIKFSQKANVKVRLVKGAYDEPEEIALTDPHEIHVKFLSLISVAFEQSPSDFGIAVASHHRQAVELALKLQEEHKKKFFQLQVLKGVLPGYYKELRSSGVHIVEYVPYGERAFAYSIRRAKKNPAYAKSILFAPFFDAYNKIYE
jgi:proline dehydrogenase